MDKEKRARLEAILGDLLQHQLSQSLAEVEASLKRWRGDELSVFETHAEVLKHAARAERMAGRIARSAQEPSASVLREALDADLMSRDEFVDLVGQDPDTVEAIADDDGLGLPDKRSFANELLTHGPMLVYIDARHKSVSVPLHLKQDPRLVLRFGYGLSPEIHDLEVDDSGISGTLTFQGMPHHCVLPWPAVYAAVSESSQRGMVWPEDVPEEVLEEMIPPKSGPGGGNPFTGVGPVPARTDGPEPAKPAKPAKRRASHLKLVE